MVNISDLLEITKKTTNYIKNFAPYPIFGAVFGTALGMGPTLMNDKFIQSEYQLHITKFNYHISIGCAIGLVISSLAGYQATDWDN